MTVIKKAERPQKIVLALLKHFTNAAYLAAVNEVVSATVLINTGDKNGCKTLTETLDLENWKQRLNMLDVVFECITSSIDKQLNLLLEKKREKSKLRYMKNLCFDVIDVFKEMK